jgi:GNAT superfamily N-acetyltransferase
MGADFTGIEEILIRAGTEADRGALAAIDAYAADHPSRIAEIESWLRSAEVLVAERAGRVVGYAAVSCEFLGQPYLAILMVGEEHRRQGVGGQLVAAACDRHLRLWTSTNESNLSMQALLRAGGFRCTGRIEGLDEGDPELFYLRDHTT